MKSALDYPGVSEKPAKPLRPLLAGLILVAVNFSCAVNLTAQGKVTFSNIGGAGVTNPLTGSPVARGTVFRAQLYYAPDGETNLMQFIPIGPSVGFFTDGFFQGGTRTTPTTTAPGDFALFQARCWETAFGGSFEDVCCGTA